MSEYCLVIREQDRNVFDDIVQGRKIIETRAATPKYQSVRVGDWFTFVCGPDSVSKSIAGIAWYENIDDLYEHVSVEKVLPSAGSIEAAKRIHLGFPGYQDKLATYGVMAFELA